MRTLSLLCLTAILPAAVAAATNTHAAERLDNAAELVTEMMQASDKGVPQDLLNKSRCVILVPGLKKAAFVLGGKFGRGFVLCRRSGGRTLISESNLRARTTRR